MEYPEGVENILSAIKEENKEGIPEIKLNYNRERYISETKINNPDSASNFFRSVFPKDTIQLQEHFYVAFLSQSNHILGYYHHATGGISGVVADSRIVLATALKTAAVGIMICHNHPSGNLSPSEADRILTKKLDHASKFIDIKLLDHIILTNDSYYSFAGNGDAGLGKLSNGFYKEEHINTVNSIQEKDSLKKRNLTLRAKAITIELELLNFSL